MEKTKWKFEEAPRQDGKVAVVTGANSGLGYETAKALAGLGARVVLACRNPERAEAARTAILRAFPNAHLTTLHLDLAVFSSVRNFAAAFDSNFDRLDFLVNNAGVMMPPYTVTDDGFELQFQTNYLSHFMLTGLLLPKLEATNHGRVVTITSLAHDWGEIYFDDLNFKSEYEKRKSYGQSKLACLLFAYELDRRLHKLGKKTESFAAHPGVADTQLSRYLPPFLRLISPVIVPFIAQKARTGALPQLRALLDDSLKGGTFIGPGGPDQYKGDPVPVDSNRNSKDEQLARKLWTLSEELTGISYLNTDFEQEPVAV